MDKEDLKKYRAIAFEAQQLHDRLRTLEASLYSPKGQRFTSMPHGESCSKSTMDEAVSNHIRLENEYKSQLADNEAQQLAIELAIKSLPTHERIIMRNRYICGHSWTRIINDMRNLGISERDSYRLHGEALKKLKTWQ